MDEKNVDITFIILHYNGLDDTIICVESIKKFIDSTNYKVVIVDNKSPDKTYDDLLKYFANDENIVIIQSESNLGFAKGNNVGIDYARNNWQSDFVAVINNDTALIEKFLLEKVREKYCATNFAVLGPLVLKGDGYCNTNPMAVGTQTREAALEKMKHYRKMYWIYKFGLATLYHKLCNILVKLNIKKHTHKELLCCEERTHVRLHGCFMVFSEKFFEKQEGFDPRTFMYFEEDILQYKLEKEGLVSLYTPEIKVYHKGEASTNRSFTTKRNKALFVFKQCYISSEIVLEILNNDI